MIRLLAIVAAFVGLTVSPASGCGLGWCYFRFARAIGRVSGSSDDRRVRVGSRADLPRARQRLRARFKQQQRADAPPRVPPAGRDDASCTSTHISYIVATVLLHAVRPRRRTSMISLLTVYVR